jgi:hypothetical protein
MPYQAYQERAIRSAEESVDTELQACTGIAQSATPLVGLHWRLEGHSLQHPGLLRMERGDDFFREDFGGPEDLDAEDIPASLNSTAIPGETSIERATSPSSQTR